MTNKKKNDKEKQTYVICNLPRPVYLLFDFLKGPCLIASVAASLYYPEVSPLLAIVIASVFFGTIWDLKNADVCHTFDNHISAAQYLLDSLRPDQYMHLAVMCGVEAIEKDKDGGMNVGVGADIDINGKAYKYLFAEAKCFKRVEDGLLITTEMKEGG
mgnify:CR=1 FL=1